MIIKNVSGQVASIPSLVGTFEVADQAEVDLLAEDDSGLPQNNVIDILRNRDLEAAFSSGDWIVISNGVELTGEQSLNLLQNQVIPNYPNLNEGLPDSIAITKNVWFDLWELDLIEGEAVSMFIDMTISYGPGSSLKIGRCTLSGCANRETGGSTEAQDLVVTLSGDIPGIRFESTTSGNTFKIRGRIRETTTLDILDGEVKLVRKVY